MANIYCGATKFQILAQRPKLTTKPTLPIKSVSEVYIILSTELLQIDHKY